MRISFQLYSARKFPPWKDVLKAVHLMGFKYVEGYSDVFEEPREFIKLLSKNRLVMATGHFTLDQLENDFKGVMYIAKTLGMSQIYVPLLEQKKRPITNEGWLEIAKKLNKINDAVTREGMFFGWHNHNFEFIKTKEGKYPMSILLDNAPEISWEIDIAYMILAKQNPEEWINKYRERIRCAHVKDIAKKGQNLDEDGWCDVGSGTIKWHEILSTFKDLPKLDFCIIEHDNPKDYKKFAHKSYRYVTYS